MLLLLHLVRVSSQLLLLPLLPTQSIVCSVLLVLRKIREDLSALSCFGCLARQKQDVPSDRSTTAQM